MQYAWRPTWRYQWPAAVGIAGMLAVAVLAGVYGPAHLGVGIAHLLASAAAAMALYFLLLMIYRHMAWRYVLDEQVIESYHGVLARLVHSIRVGDLRNINVRQSVIQRLLDVGDVEFSSAAGGDIEVVFYGVADPMGVKQLTQRLQSGAPVGEAGA